jgi:hypothetical protein
VGSRVLVGASAWLLGAASATGGSLYAIAQLGQGLVGQHTNQFSIAMVNAEFAQTAATALSKSPVTRPSPNASHSPGTPRSGGKHHVAPPVTYSSKVLTSEGGTAAANCGPDGAHLLYSSPAQGFEILRFVPGPGAVASVIFINSSIGVVMKVTCGSAGSPVAHVSDFQRGGWGPHHDE